jgi:F-type H+-transporting ATPase subunit delta
VTGSLGRRYAQALLELARGAGALAAAGEELARATATFTQPALRSLVLNPGIGAVARRRIVGQIVERLALSPTVGNLIRLLADRDRIAVLSDVARAYEMLVDRELGRARVTIRSAAPLTPQQLAELESLARRLTGAEHVIVSTEVDPGLIGGVTLAAGGTVYDGSVKTQLARLADRMARAGA